MKFLGDSLANEVKYVTQTIEKIMLEWSKNGKKKFTVKVPDSHKIKDFELLLKQMLHHYQVPVRTNVEEIPVEIKCNCGYNGKAKISDPENAIRILCPECNQKKGKIIVGKKIEVV
jgi:Zn finger protein HypA/HybF involved in hydrogenase expression